MFDALGNKSKTRQNWSEPVRTSQKFEAVCIQAKGGPVQIILFAQDGLKGKTKGVVVAVQLTSQLIDQQ